MQTDRPVFTSGIRLSVSRLISPAVAAYLIFAGFSGGDGVALFLGLALALFFAFTFHFRYELYRDALVIRFLAPRKMVVSLTDIEAAQIVRLPVGGESFVIRRSSGRAIAVRPSDAHGFLAHLEEIRHQ